MPDRRPFTPRILNGPQPLLQEAAGAPQTLQDREIAWIPAYAGITERAAGGF